MAAELDWLNSLYRTEKNLAIVISHEDEQRRTTSRGESLAMGTSSEYRCCAWPAP